MIVEQMLVVLGADLFLHRLLDAAKTLLRRPGLIEMGRPATGHDPSVSVRIPQGVLDRVMNWAKKNDYSRSIAIVGLIERGLASLEERGE
jgi:hypothetical protein